MLAPRDRRHRLPGPGRRAVHRRPGRRRCDLSRRPAPPGSSSSSTSPTASASFVMPNVLAKLDADVLVVNPYAHTAGMMAVDRDGQRRAGGRAGPGVGRAARRGRRRRRRAAHDRRRRGHGALRRPGAARPAAPRDRRPEPDARVALPVAVASAAEPICADAGVPITFTKLVLGPPDGGGGRPGTSPSPPASPGGFIWPRLPAGLRRRGHPGRCWSPCWPRPASRSPSWSGRCPPVHIAHETVVTPWEQKGLVMRGLVEQLGDRETGAGRRGEGRSRTDGWALVLPDPEEPVTHVWAEGRATPRRPRPGPQQYAVRCRAAARLSRPWSDRPGSGRVARHDRSRRSALLDRPRVGPGGRRERVRVGITDYAQDALGDVVFVDLPDGRQRGRRPARCWARSSRPSRCRRSTPR